VNSKYKEPVNDTPPPGYYNTESGEKMLSTRSPEVVFHKSVMEPIDEAPLSSKRKVATPKINASAKPKVPKHKVPKTPKIRANIKQGRNADNQFQQYLNNKKSNASSFNNTGKIPTKKGKGKKNNSTRDQETNDDSMGMSRDTSAAIFPNDAANMSAINKLAQVEEEERPYNVNRSAEPPKQFDISTKN